MVSDVRGFVEKEFNCAEDAREALAKLVAGDDYRGCLLRALQLAPDVQLEIEQDLIEKIESHWTPELGLIVRLHCGLPQRPYQPLIHCLSHQLNKEGKYEPVLIKPGVPMPSLVGTDASKNKTVKLEDEYFALAKPAALTDGIEGTTISFKEALKTYIEQHNPLGTNVTVQLAGD
eukprot:gene15917-18873_t